MVKFILGSKGSGKTKWLVDRANEDIKDGNGNIVFIDVDHNHIFTLSYDVRLVNAMEFNIKSIEAFCGFLSGIISRDYDVEKIYIDSLYKIFDIGFDEMRSIKENAGYLKEKFGVDIYMNLDYTLDEIPEDLRENCYEVEKLQLIV